MPKHWPHDKTSPQVDKILCFLKLFSDVFLAGALCKFPCMRIFPLKPRRQTVGPSVVWRLPAGTVTLTYYTLSCVCSCLPRGQVAKSVEFCVLSLYKWSRSEKYTLIYLFIHILSCWEEGMYIFHIFCLLTMPHSYIKETAISISINSPNTYWSLARN